MAPAPPSRPTGRAAVFLDRDGVINLDHGYVHRAEDLAFTPSAVEAIGLLNAAGVLVVVVTNQSGVARGYYTLDDVTRFHAALQAALGAAGAHVDAFYACPYHPDGHVAPFAVEHQDRKPNPGMLLRAVADLGIDPTRSVMIGDRETDMTAAARAGIAGRLVAADTCDLAAEARLFLARIE